MVTGCLFSCINFIVTKYLYEHVALKKIFIKNSKLYSKILRSFIEKKRLLPYSVFLRRNYKAFSHWYVSCEIHLTVFVNIEFDSWEFWNIRLLYRSWLHLWRRTFVTKFGHVQYSITNVGEIWTLVFTTIYFYITVALIVKKQSKFTRNYVF